jgi:hypothetical protein
VSTKIPFKGTSKEYIGEDAKAIFDAIKKGITVCASSLSKKIARRRQLKDKADRKRNLEKYVIDVTNAVYAVLSSEVGERAAKRQRVAASDEDRLGGMDGGIIDAEEGETLLNRVEASEITAKYIESQLRDHIETAQLFDQADGGVGQTTDLVNFYLAPQEDSRRFTHVIETVGCK